MLNKIVCYMMMVWNVFQGLIFNNSTSMQSQGQDKSNGSSEGGPRQRAEALAALSSAFSSSSGIKPSLPKPSATGQGSQRAAAVAALSNVLKAEKTRLTPDASPVQSPPSETSASGKERRNTSDYLHEILCMLENGSFCNFFYPDPNKSH